MDTNEHGFNAVRESLEAELALVSALESHYDSIESALNNKSEPLCYVRLA
jgi:hypothetical protein